MLAKEKPESCCVTVAVSVLQGPVQYLLLHRCVCFSELKLCTGMGGCSALNSYCEMSWNVEEIP